MQKWEYLVIRRAFALLKQEFTIVINEKKGKELFVEQGKVLVISGDTYELSLFRSASETELLAQLGEKGWELTNAFSAAIGGSGLYYFKRPK